MIRRSTVLLTLIWFGLMLLLQARPFDDFDTLTQIQLGRLILKAKSLYLLEAFSYQLVGHEVSNPGWLAQVLFALLFNLGGLGFLKLCHDACLAGVMVWVTKQTVLGLNRETDQSISLAAVALSPLAAFLAAASNTSVRPQVIALICFGCLMGIILRPKINIGHLLGAGLAMLIWQNAHPSLILGVLLLVTVLFARLIGPQNHGTRRELCILALLLIVAVIFQFLTPQGATVFETGRRNLEVARYWLGVSEWVPAWKAIVWKAMIPFWVLLGGTVVLIARYRNRLELEKTALFIMFSILSIYAARFAVFWALVNIPLWLTLLDLIWPARFWAWQEKRSISHKWYTLLLGLILLALVLILKARPMPDFGPDYPGKAISKLKEVLPEGRIYNYREWAGALIWEMPQKWQVAIDGRLYLYDRTTWLEYNRAALGEVAPQMLAERDRIDAFFLHKGFHTGLITRLKQENGWVECFEDEVSAVYCGNKV